jgi:pimeloyl-ACP methyl ester carboxylesterase
VAVSTGGGEREPLLLIHGLGGSRHAWDPVLSLLEPQRQVIALDLPGHGGAPVLPDGVEATAANLAAVLHERCLELGVERPHVAGNSLGAWVGLEMGRAGWAASVTALSPAGLWRQVLGPRPSSTRRWGRRLRPLVGLALRLPPIHERALTTFTPHPDRIPPAAGRQMALDWIDAPGYDAANAAMRTYLFDPDGYPEEVPVTIAWGEQDTMVGPPKPDRRPAGASFLILPGVGHVPMWDDPELIARTLLEGSSRVTSLAPET